MLHNIYSSCVILGDDNVGKRNLLSIQMRKIFPHETEEAIYTTCFGLGILNWNTIIDGKTINLQITISSKKPEREKQYGYDIILDVVKEILESELSANVDGSGSGNWTCVNYESEVALTSNDSFCIYLEKGIPSNMYNVSLVTNVPAHSTAYYQARIGYFTSVPTSTCGNFVQYSSTTYWVNTPTKLITHDDQPKPPNAFAGVVKLHGQENIDIEFKSDYSQPPLVFPTTISNEQSFIDENSEQQQLQTQQQQLTSSPNIEQQETNKKQKLDLDYNNIQSTTTTTTTTSTTTTNHISNKDNGEDENNVEEEKENEKPKEPYDYLTSFLSLDNLLCNLKRTGSFYSIGEITEIIPPIIQLNGLGILSYPLSSSVITNLIEKRNLAKESSTTITETLKTYIRSSFGGTVRKQVINNVWQFDTSEFTIQDSVQYKKFIQDSLEKVGFDLGITVPIIPELCKLIIYEKGRPNVKTLDNNPSSDKDIFGKLIVNFPSHHKGGDIVLDYSGNKENLSLENNDTDFGFQWVAYYIEYKYKFSQNVFQLFELLTKRLEGEFSNKTVVYYFKNACDTQVMNTETDLIKLLDIFDRIISYHNSNIEIQSTTSILSVILNLCFRYSVHIDRFLQLLNRIIRNVDLSVFRRKFLDSSLWNEPQNLNFLQKLLNNSNQILEISDVLLIFSWIVNSRNVRDFTPLFIFITKLRAMIKNCPEQDLKFWILQYYIHIRVNTTIFNRIKEKHKIHRTDPTIISVNKIQEICDMYFIKCIDLDRLPFPSLLKFFEWATFKFSTPTCINKLATQLKMQKEITYKLACELHSKFPEASKNLHFLRFLCFISRRYYHRVFGYPPSTRSYSIRDPSPKFVSCKCKFCQDFKIFLATESTKHTLKVDRTTTLHLQQKIAHRYLAPFKLTMSINQDCGLYTITNS
eukprot:gene3735-4654_t